MSKPARQALAAQLTAALASVLPALPGPLPNGVAQAVDHLADSMLRWQARQQRPTRLVAKTRIEASATDALIQLMDGHLHEEAELPEDDTQPGTEVPIPPSGTTSLPAGLEPKKPRARFKRELPRS